MMSLTEFDWQGVSERLAGVRDDDIRGEALMIARTVWQRRATRGKACRVPTLCWRAVQLARRRANRDRHVAGNAVFSLQTGNERVDGSEFGGKCLIDRRASDRPDVSAALARMTDRQRTIAAGLMEGRTGRDIAESIGVHPAQVSREMERLAQFFPVDAH